MVGRQVARWQRRVPQLLMLQELGTCNSCSPLQCDVAVTNLKTGHVSKQAGLRLQQLRWGRLLNSQPAAMKDEVLHVLLVRTF